LLLIENYLERTTYIYILNIVYCLYKKLYFEFNPLMSYLFSEHQNRTAAHNYWQAHNWICYSKRILHTAKKSN